MTLVKNKQQPNIRLLAVKALSDINRNGAYANIKLQEYLRTYHLEDLDRRFFTELVYGVIRRRNYLDAIIVHFANRPIKKLSSMVVEILRLGIYQILYMDKVPESAAVNESVKLAKKLTRGLSGFVNAVMRSVLRDMDSISIGELATSEAEEISFIYNQPLWLVELWLNEMGKDKTIDLCSWFNEQSRLTARINTIKVSVDECLQELRALGWTVDRDEYIPECIYIDGHQGHLEKARPVLDGHITFMDKPSMLVAHVVNPQPGERILDCCAAPGGKSMHMASLMENTGAIMSCDIYEHKLQLMQSNVERLGVSIISMKLQDGRTLPDSWINQFDRVLVDAPCSGLGILQKKLDMRWRKSRELLFELPTLQLEILECASKMVKVGGYLVYSTCTLNHGENEDVLEKFLEHHKDFVIEPVELKGLPSFKDGMITTYPPRDDMDGFFMARMKRLS